MIQVRFDAAIVVDVETDDRDEAMRIASLVIQDIEAEDSVSGKGYHSFYACPVGDNEPEIVEE